MKQHINKTDLDMLTKQGRHRLDKWFEENVEIPPYIEVVSDGQGYGAELEEPLLGIGQLIEFLEKNSDSSERDIEQFFTKVLDFGKYSDKTLVAIGWTGELCDCLWAAAVEILNKE